MFIQYIKNSRSHFMATVLLCISLIFGSCNKKTDLGNSILSDEEKALLDMVDTFSVYVQTQKQDSLPMFGINNQLYSLFDFSPRLLLGRYYSPSFGYSSANLNFQITPVSNNVSEDYTGIVIDSVVLAMLHTGYYGPQGISEFNVYELDELFSYNTTYYSDYQSQKTNLLGTSIFNSAYGSDSVSIDGTLEPAQIRVKLNASYGQKLIQHITSDNFKDFVRGLYVTIDTAKSQTAGVGSIHYVSLLDQYSGVTVYYKKNNSAKKLKFEVGDSCVYFSSFEHQYSNTPVQASLVNTEQNQDKIYIQSMQGLQAKVLIPFLNELKNKGNAIAKAELEFVCDPSQDAFSSHAQLLLVTKSDNGFYQNISDITEGISYYGGTYNVLNQTYTFTITRYIQDKIKEINLGDESLPELYLIPDKLGVYDGQKTILFGKDQVRLKIYYINL